MIRFSLLIITCLFSTPGVANCFGQQSTVDHYSGMWAVTLNVGTDEAPNLLPFQLKLEMNQGTLGELIFATVINGTEEIPVAAARNRENSQLLIDMPHYASRILFETSLETDIWSGTWTKRRGKDNTASVPCTISRYVRQEWETPERFTGRWSVKFADSEDLAVAVFKKAGDSNQVLGTFLTTTGDYRYLAGGVKDGKLMLSCFDGGHAFLFKVKSNKDHSLSGTFHSGNWYQDTWTATRDETASLPDAFQQTVWVDSEKLADLKFPNLDGQLVSLNDEQFAGKCRIIEVFGTWCPNCHDAASYLTELHEKYGDRGLSIVGLAFELTGDFETDAGQVRTFRERTLAKYPILVAGTADKTEATRQLRVLDRVRSYPTMIFLDGGGNVKAIYSGFSGPATGEAHVRLREQFEKIIETTLNE